MSRQEICELTIEELGEFIRHKKASPVEIADNFIERTEKRNPKVNAYISFLPEKMRQAAQKAEADLLNGNIKGPLHGIPIAVKDLFAMKDTRTTGGSKIFADNVTTYDSAVVEKLVSGGACVTGKTNMHELAYGTTSINQFFGPVRNPWQLEYHTGGSSGGSAAAVADRQVPGAIGTDTGASVRLPASYSGLVGLKPTYGRISRYGVLPLSWSHDHVGPMARTVRDCAILYEALSGYDARDISSCQRNTAPCLAGIEDNISDIRIGILDLFLKGDCNEEIQNACENAIRGLAGEGAKTQEIPSEQLNTYGAISFIVIAVESTEKYLAHSEQNPKNVSREVGRFLRLGKLFSGQQYLKAQRVRNHAIRWANSLFSDADVLVLPTSPELPTLITETTSGFSRNHEYTIPFNFLGLPAVTVPCGMSKSGLPIGLQIVGPPYGEDLVLRVARSYERLSEWHKMRLPA